MDSFPLVSVPVVTYNSSKTILETLESIYNQTYPNIELIISDDCSTDDTVDICHTWIEEHKDRFARVKVLTSKTNTGVSGNANRAEQECHGEWRKGIAGDDIMFPNCIQDCIDYVVEHPDVIWLFGQIRAFGENKELVDHFNERFNTHQSFYSLSKEEQHKSLIIDGNNIPASTAFVNISKDRDIGVKNDERIPLLEDHPKWLNLTKVIQLHWVDKPLVGYRIHQGSLSNSGIFSSEFRKNGALFFILYLYPELKVYKPMLAYKKYVFSQELLHDNKGYWHIMGTVSRFYENYLRKAFRK